MHPMIASSFGESFGCVRGLVSVVACARYASITQLMDLLSIHVSPAAILRTHLISRSGEIERGTTPRTPETLDAALKEIEAELALNPSDAVAIYQAARILQVRQRSAEAEAGYERALKLRPDFVEAESKDEKIERVQRPPEKTRSKRAALRLGQRSYLL